MNGINNKTYSSNTNPDTLVLHKGQKKQILKWVAYLDKAGQDLHQLMDHTGREFLVICEKLTNFSLNAKEISQMTLSVAELLSGKEIVDAIKALKEILDRISGYLKHAEEEVQHNIEILQQVLMMIDPIFNPLKGFEKIIKMLNILGTATKIENARLDSNNDKFSNLSEAVRNLSNNMKSKIVNIEESSELLSRIINEKLTKIFKLKEIQYSQTTNILGNIKACLTTLLEKQHLSSETAKDLSIRSNEISTRIDEVVISLQFHDITRQKIEHVKETLDELAGEFEAELKNNIRIRLSDCPNLISLVKKTGAICELQAAQIRLSRDEILSAVHGIIGSLNGIVKNITDISGNVQQLVTISHNDRKAFFKEIESGIESIITSLFTNVKVNLELTSTIKSIVEMVREMDGFVKDIKKIDLEIELIALNGLINAAHIGNNEGAALSILAESIQRLSVDARQQIITVSYILEGMIAAGEGLKHGTNTEISENEIVVEDIKQDLENILTSLRQVNDKLTRRFVQMTHKAQFVTADIKETITGIKVHKLSDNVLTGIISTLDEIARQSRELVPETNENEKVKNIKNLTMKYTMKGERDIHNSFIKLAEERLRPLPKEENSLIVKKSGESEFGDNVQLF